MASSSNPAGQKAAQEACNPVTNLRNHFEEYINESGMARARRGLANMPSSDAATLHDFSTRDPKRPGMIRRFVDSEHEVDQGHEDPFISLDSRLRIPPEPPLVSMTPLNYIGPPVQLTTPPDFARAQVAHDGLVRYGLPFNGEAFHQSPNIAPSGFTRSSVAGGSRPIRTPPRPIPPHVEDRRPNSATVPLNHPLRCAVQRIRESRAGRLMMWNICAARNPEQCNDMNWSMRKSYEKDMKQYCTDELSLLESIEGIEEGEDYEDVDLHPQMLRQCLEYEKRLRRGLGRNPGSFYNYMAQGYGSEHPLHPSHPQHSTFPPQAFETVLPSIEKDSDDENEKFNEKKEEKSTQSTYATSEMPLRHHAFTSLPIREPKGQRYQPFGVSSNTFVLPDPVIYQSVKHEFSDAGRMNLFTEVIDLTGNEYARPNQPERHQPLGRGVELPATPRIKLTAAGLAQKRLRDPEATPFGSTVDRKRQKLITDYIKSDAQKETSPEIQKFRRHAASVGKALPEEAVFSDEDYEEDGYDDEDVGGFRISSV